MKRVLIITYYWPPSGGAGVQRWLKFVKYLRGSGWEPVVFCPENPEYPEIDLSLSKDIPANLEVVRTRIWEPYSFYKRLLGRKKEERINAAFTSETKKNNLLEGLSVWVRGNFFIPDARKFWINPSVKFLRRYLALHPVDAIVSTGPPHSTHLIARALADKPGLPWLADFRDPWTSIDFYKDLKLSGWADRRHHRMELDVLRNASAVTVISRHMASDFDRLYSRDYHVITNGFDPDDVAGSGTVQRDEKFSIAHIGTLAGSRNPLTLWKALQELLQENENLSGDLEIKLVGKVDYSVMASLEESGLSGFLRKIAYMPHDEVTLCQRQSQVLLLIINNTPNARMILTGKFFEYLAAGRPILCLGPEEGDAAAILEETRAGRIAGFGDVEKMKEHLAYYYRLFREGNLEVSAGDVQPYSRRELTGKLAAVLGSITAG